MTDATTQPAWPSPVRVVATAEQEPHPLDALVRDPSGMSPLCDEEPFAAILEGMVANTAPRVFAVVQEYGVRVDFRIVAWGIAFEDRVEVTGVKGDTRMNLRSPEDALPGFYCGTYITPRLVWVNPEAVKPADDDDPA